MSRTRKDRPYWVLKNDPKMARYATHDHLVTLSEVVGEEPVYRTMPTKDGWHWQEVLWYTRKLYKHTRVEVDCTLDVPEGGPSKYWGKARTKTNEERLAQKNCYWWLEYYPNVKSSKEYKRLTNGATRSKVRQQLHSAVRDLGTYWEDDDWYDVDIFEDSKHLSRGWWDW